MLLQIDSSMFVVDGQSLVHLQMSHFLIAGYLDHFSVGGYKSLLQWNLHSLGSTPSVDALEERMLHPELD